MDLEMIEFVSLLLSLGGGAIAVISLYQSSLKRGQLMVLPLRMYRLEPLHFGGVRCLKLTAPMTFINTGAGHKSVADLRIRVPLGNDELIFGWREERDELAIYNQEGPDVVRYPNQPTVFPYDSVSRIYGFTTTPEQADILEAFGSAEADRTATLEARMDSKGWVPIGSFTLHYRGRTDVVDDYETING